MKAVVYARVSTEQQAADDKTSLGEQERVCREYAERQGWTVEKVFVDAGISGETIEERPQMRNLLIECVGGKFAVVLAYHQDRLGRGEFGKIGGILKAAGVKFATPGGVLDLTMPADKFTFNIFAAVAEYEKDRIAERMLGGKIARARKGEFAFAFRPYGYRWDKETGRPVEVEEEIGNVRELFRLADERKASYGEIAEIMRGRRVPTRTQADYEAARRQGEEPRRAAGIWRDSTVRTILSSRCYKGEWVMWPIQLSAKSAALLERLGLANDRQEVLAKDPPPAAVTPEVWEGAQAARRRNTAKRLGQRLRRQFLLSGGMVKCECGSTMTAREPRPTSRYYGCNRSIRGRRPDGCETGYISADALDAKVWAKVEELCADPRAMQALADRTEREQAPRWRRELKGTMQDLDGLGFEMAAAQAAYRKGVDSLDQYAAQKQAIEKQREELTAEKARLEALLESVKGPTDAAERLAKVAALFGDKLPSLDLEGRRRVLRMLEVEVTVSEGGQCLVEWLGDAFTHGSAACRGGLAKTKNPMLYSAMP